MTHRIKTLVAALACCVATWAQPDPNFHIYLCLGQSNMEGNASPENIDRNNVPEQFRMMAAVNFSNPSRKMYNWYKATPPLVRQDTGLTPADWFGRTMVANMPEDVRIGVVMVAIGGCKIEHLDKDFDPASIASEADWFKNYMAAYDNQPYKRLISCAKKAQEAGVIKGILLHQGCSNNGDQQWCKKVKKIYEDLLADLDLRAEDVPLLAGEVVRSDMGGVCGGMNGIINTLPKTIATSHVISAANLPQKGDGLHFTAHGYRVLGCRYAEAMLKTMGISDPVVEYQEEEPEQPTPNPAEGDFIFDLDTFNPSIWENGKWDNTTHIFTAGQYGFGGWQWDQPIDLSGYKYIVAEIDRQMGDWCKFRVFDTASYWEEPYSNDMGTKTLLVAELDGMMKNLSTGIVPLDTKNIYRVGFWDLGGRPFGIKQVFATNNDPYDTTPASAATHHTAPEPVYTLTGTRIADTAKLPHGIYVCGGKKVVVRQ